jgi:hypothetical protein
MLHGRLAARARGDHTITPLTATRHLSLEDKRARRAARERSRAAREDAMSHLKAYNEQSDIHASGINASGVSGVSAGDRGVSMMMSDDSSAANAATLQAERIAAEHPEFRKVVIDFIKKEIQPLYDTSQITKKRFIDIVARVSAWFLNSHRPTSELSEVHVSELVRRIQQVISWQDSERQRKRTYLDA